MAEIKSTLELALERTKRFALSEKDKEEIRQKEIEQKTLSLFYRFRSNHLHLHEIQKEMERMDEKAREKVKEGLLSLLVETLSLEEDNEKMLRGVESLKRQPMDEIKIEFRELFTQYQQERNEIKQKVASQLLDDLKKKGIAGDAVEPNVEGSSLLKGESLRLSQKFYSRLEGIKEKIRIL